MPSADLAGVHTSEASGNKSQLAEIGYLLSPRSLVDPRLPGRSGIVPPRLRSFVIGAPLMNSLRAVSAGLIALVPAVSNTTNTPELIAHLSPQR